MNEPALLLFLITPCYNREEFVLGFVLPLHSFASLFSPQELVEGNLALILIDKMTDDGLVGI